MITDKQVEAALEAANRLALRSDYPTLAEDCMRAALEAAEAAREPADYPNPGAHTPLRPAVQDERAQGEAPCSLCGGDGGHEVGLCGEGSPVYAPCVCNPAHPKNTTPQPSADDAPALPCQSCKGTGSVPESFGGEDDGGQSAHDRMVDCPKCDGAGTQPSADDAPFQARVQPWMMACFGAEIAADRAERNHRFTEEALELVQANGMPRADAHALVDYVYSRPAGELAQEVGGVMVTLAALCLASGTDMHADGETELQRINAPDMIEKIRTKQAAKPRGSALPAAAQPSADDAPRPVAWAMDWQLELVGSLSNPLAASLQLSKERTEKFTVALYAASPADVPRHDSQMLKRYGIRWNGPDQPICTPMEDGYWTPWHVAASRIEKLMQQELPIVNAAPPADARDGGSNHGLDTDTHVFFYEQDFYVLSNFSAFRVTFRGTTFDTAEAAYHYQRFTSAEDRRGVLYTESAHDSFRYAQAHKANQRPDWDAIKFDVMREILRAKADQHEYVRRKLLATGDRILVENSWRDDVWGWGPNRDGQNMLGKLWMEIRAELRAKADRAMGGE